ncbi:hypothetical protein BD410DRAFT_637041 [Rickenella mellea]|uniref:DUF6699 domain-containing protein n=1 Tax=Rickenella mellea TaxID=50990 RepID=A0A4Y7QER7_9AGAM|nr:hypothetical protein BD410DRAFT_637041 [Rickenella mellea]
MSSPNTKRVHWGTPDVHHSPRPMPKASPGPSYTHSPRPPVPIAVPAASKWLRTPSPAWSDSDSLPDSQPPQTPQSPAHRHIPLPEPSKPTLEPFIAFHPQFTPALRYNVADHWSSLRLSSEQLSRPAVYPPVPEMHIHIQALRQYKPIHVVAASSRKGVLVSEVLDAVWTYLQNHVSKREYDLSPTEMQRLVSVAFQERCERMGKSSAAEAERQKGLKRVDCLMGSNIWGGLTTASSDPRMCVLHLVPRARR